MKTILLVLTAAGLSGCAVYPVPSYLTYPTYPTYPTYQTYPTYPTYGGGSTVVVVPVPVRRVGPHRVPPPAVRYGRDRDGDGVPDRADRWPNDPRHR